jgi:cell division protease FtsH
MEDFESSKDKVLMGKERKSMILSEQEKKVTAYHEAGHALIAYRLQDVVDQLHKVTIIPRGLALGVTQTLPQEDKHTYTKEYVEGKITQLMGGRCAEQMTFGPDRITTGAANDIETATEMARKMVCEWGMSQSMGPLTFGRREEMIFLGREIAQHKDYSEDTAVKIDQEVKRIIMEASERAAKILNEQQGALTRLAEALLEHEVLDSGQIEQIMQGLSVSPSKNPATKSPGNKKEPTVVDASKEPSIPPLVNPGNKPAPA